MKKLLSLLLIFLLISNMFVFEVFASTQIDLSIYSIKRNGGDAHNIDIEVYPGDTLSFLISGKNKGDTITNVEGNFTFSSNNFSYINKGTVDFYKNWYVETENIPTSLFNPPLDNTIPMTSEAIANDILDLYYFDLVINQDVPDNVITTSAKITSLEGNSNTLSRNIFINSNPHIVDYYFEKAGSKITQFSRGGEQIDFLIKVKDYNGCENIDNGTVSANLSSLGLGSNELLSFLSCDTGTKTAIFKKSAISTLVFPTTLSFDYSNFSVTDESGNVNKPNDSQTSFDNEDKKDSISLVVSSAGTPDLSYTIDDDYIGSSSNNISVLSSIGNQNGDLKISLGSDSSCNGGTTLYDWTSYLANTNIDSNINASDLLEGINNIFLCLKNDENIIGSTNLNITKDITNPLISSVRVTPVNIVLENSTASFICSEDGTFRIEKGGNGTLDSGTILSSGSVTSLIEQSQIVSNSDLGLNDNTIYIYCIDEAGNSVSQEMTINKTTPPPSFAAENVSFLDNDIDYDGLDGRDIYFSWDNNLGLNYDYFGSYVLYVLPDNIPFDTTTQQNIGIITDASINSFTGTTLITKDSLGNDFVSESNYKMCILINGTNGLLGTEKCSSSTVLTSDDASHANILSAKFTSDNNLEITTDVVLDSNKSAHKPDFISFDYNGSTVIGKAVSSIDSKKINIEIDSLSSISAVGTNLIVLTGALRASTGGFNDLINFSNITDGQTPIISTPINNTSSIYNNFFNGIINLAYVFQEEMLTSFTKFEITRIGGNLDSNTYFSQITGPNLYTGNHNSDIDLSSLNLIDGVYYQIKLLGKDLAGNYNTSGVLSNIKYDSVGPDIVVQNITSLYSTLTPELSWNIPLDNNGNGSGIKEYKLDVFNGNDCIGDINKSYTVNTNSKVIDAVINIADYSWEVVAIDNIGNTGIKSICSNFRVDTSVPVFSDFEINDLTLNSSIYISNTNPIQIKSTITDTDKDHIWLDISMITGNTDNNYESCANPSAGITCDYVGNLVTYNFNAGNSLVDGTKQVIFNAQNTSGGNDVQQIISTTSDSNSPTIDLGAFISPTGIVGGTGTTVTWDNSKIYDTIGLDYLQVEYSTGAGTWNIIGTGSNIGYMDWDLIDIASGVDYKIKITAFDKAGNNSETISSIFEVDRTNPVIPDDTITYPVGGEILGGLGTIVITWDNSLITDNILAVNPISLFYSIDGGSSWNLIGENLANNGSYSWIHGNLNSQDVLLKITAFDSVGNFESSEINNTFTIDTISPVLNFDFSSTPVNGKYINNSGFDVLGSNFDIHDLSTSYSLIDLTSGEYFNGTSFTGTTEIFNQICLDTQSIGSNENCNLISFTLVPGIIDSHNYRFKLKSIDEAGNETFSIPLDYIGDTINPNISILTSSGTYFKDSILIEGNSSDLGSGISSVKIQIKKGNDYWDGNDFVNSIQTLNTNSVNNFSTWSYNFNYNGDDGEYLVTSIAYDKSFKVNNISEQSIIVNKDTTAPEITGGANIFTSPLLNDIYIGGTNVNIFWNSGSILDNGSGLKNNPISLDYFNGIEWINIVSDIENDGEYIWNSLYIDSNNVKIKIGATDNVGNISYQNSNNFTVDSTDPTISSIETMDLDADGKIDALNIIMSEDIRDTTVSLSDFTISDGIGNPTGFETGNSINDNRFVLKFPNTGNTSLRPKVTYNKGGLTDIAGKYLSTYIDFSSIDKASPRLLEAGMYDIDGNGKFDTIKAIFSESLYSTSDTSVWSIDNILNGITINSVSISGNQADIILNEGINYNTAVGSMKINLSSNSNWKDFSNNLVGNVVSGDIDDLAKPVIYSAEYFDDNSNYKVDRVLINFSENILGFNENDFNISGLNKGIGVLNNNQISFNIIETVLDNDTGVVSILDFTGGNLKDSLDNFSDNINDFIINDKVNPKLISKTTNDIDGNGKIDSIILTYSESLNSDFINFVGEVDSYNISNYSKLSDSKLLINLQEKDDYDSSETPLVRVISNSSLTDVNGNLVEEFGFTPSDDKVGPVIIGARYDESTHKIFIQTSEDLNDSNFTIGNFVLNNAGLYSIIGANSIEKSITLSGENISFGNTSISFKANSVDDLFGNKQQVEYFTKISPPIIINEIMLSSNPSDNYIELKNLSSLSVDISNYTIAGITIPASSSIEANGYYLIAKDSKDNSILNVDANLTNSNLNISGTTLILNNGVMDVDFANLLNGLFDTSTPKSIERKNNAGDGLLTSSWYTAQDSVNFDNIVPFGTPKAQNMYDTISPTISSYTPSDNTLFPVGNFDINFVYSDNVGGLGINTSSDNLSISKWNGSSWGTDISGSYLDSNSKLITSTSADYSVSGLGYGKYKIAFNISDKAGNLVSKTIIIYVDEFSFDLNTNSIDIGGLTSNFNVFSTNEAILTIKTVGAGFSIDLIKNGLLTNNGTDIIDFDGNYGFGYDQDNGGYSGIIKSIGNSVNITNVSKNINTNGDKNTFVYKIKFGAKIDIIQGAGIYEVNPNFKVLTNY